MTAQDHSHDSHDNEHSEHADHGGVKKYIVVFAALCVLTTISFIIGNSTSLPPQVAWIAMMAVSCAKAMLVMLFFMHLIWEANWKYVLTIPASVMSIFLVLMLVPDIGNRTEHYDTPRWLHAAEPELSHVSENDQASSSHQDEDKASVDH